ncbi:MAG: hypothetical protein AAFR93_03020 [Pseudomonadota bacterium]
MADHQFSAGEWAVSLDDAAFQAKLDEVLAEVLEETPEAADLNLSIARDVTKNMGGDGASIYEVLLIIAGHEALKAATREVVTQTVQTVIKRLRDLLRAEPDDEIKDTTEAPSGKDDARQ